MTGQFNELELRIKEPDGNHEREIGFETQDPKLVMAYNWAIEDVTGSAGFTRFHQHGVVFGNENEPGHHAWEVYGASREQVQNLLPQIHSMARDYF